MKKIVLKSLATFAVGFVMTAGVASAELISGEVSISGGFEPTGGTDLSSATGLEFTEITNGYTLVVTGTTGNFSEIDDTYGTISDFLFSDSDFILWEIDGFTFTLETISIDTQNATDLDLSGTGYISYAGYDDTPGAWNFSGQTVSGATFSWSSTNSAVPEPTTMLLFGTGIAGLASFRRRQKD